jgi:predicted RNA methylase
MDLNIISKIFPTSVNNHLLGYDEEGLYSITLPNEANDITCIINDVICSDTTICDGTAGIGGNTISFGKKFKKVISIELCENRFNLLVNNINAYNLNNIETINGSCLDHLNIDCDAFYFDPPWGGPDYKTKENLTFKIGNMRLFDVVKKIRESGHPIVFFKLPKNYNLSEFNEFNYNINKIKNYLLITIF